MSSAQNSSDKAVEQSRGNLYATDSRLVARSWAGLWRPKEEGGQTAVQGEAVD